MLSGARLRTVEWLGAAPDGRILNGGAAVAYALFEAGHQAALAQALVTELVALVQAAVEHTIAHEHANVHARVVTAHLVACVAST